jgi:hypothetical protein
MCFVEDTISILSGIGKKNNIDRFVLPLVRVRLGWGWSLVGWVQCVVRGRVGSCFLYVAILRLPLVWARFFFVFKSHGVDMLSD